MPDNKENTPLSLTVDEAEAGTRLDKWLADRCSELSRSRVRALIEGGHVVSAGAAPAVTGSTRVRAGETYQLTLPPLADPAPQPEDIPLDVLFEDEHLIVLNKPAGMVVHPAAGNDSGTLVNALLHHCGASLSGIGGVARPGIVHRLDKDTSGVMVVAKHDTVHRALSALFAAHDLERTYQALVHGAPRPGMGTIVTGLARSPHDRKKMAAVNLQQHDGARKAVTRYRVLEHFGQGRAKLPGESLASLVACDLETGRTHQIRVHMAHLGHPLIGDQVYGRGPGLAGLKPGEETAEAAIDTLRRFRRQALHATRLAFVHPVSGETLSFETPPPADFQSLFAALKAL